MSFAYPRSRRWETEMCYDTQAILYAKGPSKGTNYSRRCEQPYEGQRLDFEVEPEYIQSHRAQKKGDMK